MIKIEITEDVIKRAEGLYEFGSLKNSVTEGRGNIYGSIGEVAVYDFFTTKGDEVVFESTYDYDLIINGYKVDVKTKRTTVTPRGYYNCGIFAFNTTQECDYYFFVRVSENLEVCYLLGYKGKADFFNTAVFNKKGEPDGDNWTFPSDTYNLKISELNKFKSNEQI